MKLVRKPTTRAWRALFCTTALVSTVIPAAGAAYPDLILGDHPVGYYRLEEPASSTTAVDSGPNHFDATYVYDLDTNGVPDYPVLGLPGLDTNAPLFLVSCRTGAGVNAWVDWLGQMKKGVEERSGA